MLECDHKLSQTENVFQTEKLQTSHAEGLELENFGKVDRKHKTAVITCQLNGNQNTFSYFLYFIHKLAQVYASC